MKTETFVQNHNKISPHTCQNSDHQKTGNKYWGGCGKNGILIHCWQERKLLQPLWKIV